MLGGGAVGFFYKFPSEYAFQRGQNGHIPIRHTTNVNAIPHVKQYLALSSIKTVYEFSEQDMEYHGSWLYPDNLFEYVASVNLQDRWPLYIVSTLEREFLYILHPNEREKIANWIAGCTETSKQMENLIDELRWHPQVGSTVNEIRERVTKKKRTHEPG